jgi:hypothetical protein
VRGDLFPPHTQRFQGEIFNTPRLCRGDFYIFYNFTTILGGMAHNVPAVLRRFGGPNKRLRSKRVAGKMWVE